MKAKKKYMDSTVVFDTDWAKVMKAAESETELTQKMVDALIEAVYVYDDKRVEVKFKYAECRNDMVCIMETMMKGVE